MENKKPNSSEEIVRQLLAEKLGTAEDRKKFSQNNRNVSAATVETPERKPESTTPESAMIESLSGAENNIEQEPEILQQPIQTPIQTPAPEEAPAETPEQSMPTPTPEMIRAADILEERAARSKMAAKENENTKVRTEEDSLYDDLDGISQTQMHKKKTNAVGGKEKKKKKKKGMRALRSIMLAAFILIISIVLALLIIVYGRDVLGINNDSTTKIVTIPQGADTSEIADILEKEGVITYPSLFKVFAGFSGKDANFTAGDHELRPDMAYDTIFENLASPSLGSKDVVNIAFPEGITIVEAADLLEDQGICDADDFIDYFNNKSKCGLAYESHLPSFTNGKFYKMEGYLFPDTYQFYTNMDVDLVCQKILRNFNDKITDRDYERMETLGISLDDTLIIASMIQREAGSLDQMTRISSVFWNRLNNPQDFPKLQSDPTGGYVEDVIKPHIDEYDQELFNSYDTYICDGLPAGAICNPGYDAIQAALYPASTDYFYFYSNINTKETYFSRTLAEHEAWIKKVKGNQFVATEPVITITSGDSTDTAVSDAADENSDITTTTEASE